MCASDPRLTSPAPEILAYLLRQPQAQDSMQRIQWAVLPFCVGNVATKIADTAKELVELGYLEKDQPSPEILKGSSSKTSETKALYRLSRGYLSTLRQGPPPNCTADDDEQRNQLS